LVSQIEVNNFLDILGNLNEQIDMLRIQNTQKVEIVASFVFFPKFRKKHYFHEFPLDNIKICETCGGSHTTKYFPTLPRLKVVYNGENQTLEQFYYVALRRPR